MGKFTFDLVKDTQLSFAAPYMKDTIRVDASDPTVAVVTYPKPPARRSRGDDGDTPQASLGG